MAVSFVDWHAQLALTRLLRQARTTSSHPTKTQEAGYQISNNKQLTWNPLKAGTSWLWSLLPRVHRDVALPRMNITNDSLLACEQKQNTGETNHVNCVV
mgnify:CR=1 FL=1